MSEPTPEIKSMCAPILDACRLCKQYDLRCQGIPKVQCSQLVQQVAAMVHTLEAFMNFKGQAHR